MAATVVRGRRRERDAKGAAERLMGLVAGLERHLHDGQRAVLEAGGGALEAQAADVALQ